VSDGIESGRAMLALRRAIPASPACRLQMLTDLGPPFTVRDPETGEEYERGAGILTKEQIMKILRSEEQ